MTFRSLAVPFTFLLACSTVSAGAPGGEPHRGVAAQVQAATPSAPPPGRSAGDLDGSAGTDLDAAQIEALRAEGPAALGRLLDAYDRAGTEDVRATMAATIDKVAGQRYATVSRLYWYEDLDAARAAARASGKPILSLRMLGRLDEDLSCANSRFFRTTLYPNVAVSKLLRERFILHWSSERQVPRVTVDFGDGRTLASTVTGNSAHYILDAEGRPLDVLPGLYAPAVFRRELEAALGVHRTLQAASPAQRNERLIAYHQAALQRMNARWSDLPRIPVIAGARGLLTGETVRGAAAAAQRATMSKAYVEVPMLRTVDVGVDPGKLPDDVELWAEIGQQLLDVGAPPDAAESGALVVNPWELGVEVRVAAGAKAPVKGTAGKRPAAAASPILDARARTLVDAMIAVPVDGTRLDPTARAAVIARLEQTIVADTALNEVRLRPQIRGYLIGELMRGDTTFAELNRWVYATVFHAPAEDAWLGLLPRDTFTGLPGGAVTTGS
jgi:hypothetical protein